MYKLLKYYPAGHDIQQYWEDKYAKEHIAGKSLEEYPRQDFWPLLKKQLTKDKTYLDAGCGVGGWILFLNEEGYNVEGIDVAARIVRAMTEYDRDLKVKVAGVTQIPYADATLDGVLAIGVLEYVEDKVPEALREIHRVLRPEGLLFLEVPVANMLRRLFYTPLKEMEKVLRRAQGRQPTFSSYFFGVQELSQLLKSAGFRVEEVNPHELPDAYQHYGLWVDWKILRGKEAYQLNILGRIVQAVSNAISPWIASTGMVVVARKQEGNSSVIPDRDPESSTNTLDPESSSG